MYSVPPTTGTRDNLGRAILSFVFFCNLTLIHCTLDTKLRAILYVRYFLTLQFIFVTLHKPVPAARVCGFR
jgi:hypothetical protein